MLKSNGYLRFDETFHCIRDSNINPRLQSRYTELLLVMFVDVGDNQPYLDNLPYSFVRETFKLEYNIAAKYRFTQHNFIPYKFNV